MADSSKALEDFSRTHNRLCRFYDSCFSDGTLTSGQASVLYFLMNQSPDIDTFPTDLEVYLDLKKPSVTSLLNYLEKDGYIRRLDVAYDGRHRKIVLTQKALDIRSDIIKKISDYRETAFRGISDKDMEAFDRVLKKIMDNLP